MRSAYLVGVSVRLLSRLRTATVVPPNTGNVYSTRTILFAPEGTFSGLKFTAKFPKHVDCVNAYALECQRYRFSKAGIYAHILMIITPMLYTFIITELVMATSRQRLSFYPSADGNTADNQRIICSLCLAPHTQMSTPLSWKNIQAQDIARIRLHLTHESHVCRLCRDDISRLVKSPHIIPRWEKTGRKLNCCVPMCTSTSFSTTQIASDEEIAHILSCENLPHPTPLCKQHYHLVYDSLRSKQTHCCTCIRSGRKCICPDPQRIQQYLEINTGFEATIPENGRVCTPCYEAQLVILKEDTVSTDDDLRSLISELKASLLSIGNIKSENDILNQAT